MYDWMIVNTYRTGHRRTQSLIYRRATVYIRTDDCIYVCGCRVEAPVGRVEVTCCHIYARVTVCIRTWREGEDPVGGIEITCSHVYVWMTACIHIWKRGVKDPVGGVEVTGGGELSRVAQLHR